MSRSFTTDMNPNTPAQQAMPVENGRFEPEVGGWGCRASDIEPTSTSAANADYLPPSICNASCTAPSRPSP